MKKCSMITTWMLAVVLYVTGTGLGGNLYAKAVDLPEGAADWPMWRYDAARSAQTPVVLSEDLHLQWVRELPEPMRAWRHQLDNRDKLEFDVSYSPVVMGDKIFVPSNVTDNVTAYHIEDGTEQWRFYADGPVRLAPAAWEGKVYFVSDDGHLYCVEAETGELVWKFRGGPSDHRLLGNERIINFWPARGGPVVKDGKVYFTAGIWPMHGIFIYALDAEGGDVVWVNDTISSDYIRVYRGSVYGGIAPQGYIAAAKDHLIVSGGRGGAALIDRDTGRIEDQWFDEDRERGQYGVDQATEGGYAVHAVDDGNVMKRLKNDMLEDRVEALEDKIDGEVFYKLAAHDRLFVTTEDGTLYCFGPEETEPKQHEFSPTRMEPATNDWADIAVDLLDELDNRGYALMLGAGSGDLLRELLARSELHIVVVESDSEKVNALRDALAKTGMSGRRAAVIEAEPATFAVQPYLFSLVVSEDAAAAGIAANESVMNRLLDKLRPYSGIAWLGASGQELSELRDAAVAADVDQVSVGERADHLLATRDGPLSGAGEWTHQYHDGANTLLSQDKRVRLPLGMLWFGGPNNHNILPRHTRGPRPQVVGGRQFFLGVETIASRCVYTGRELWEREFSGIGHPFTRLEDEERWEEGHYVYLPNLPGSVYIGSPFVSLANSIYLRHEGLIHVMDPATGENLVDPFSLPGRSAQEIYDDEDAPEWGHISVQGDFLILTSEPHLFEGQKLGRGSSYSGTSSRRIAVLDRYSGEVFWEREARVGFRHNAIVSSEGMLYVIDGLSEEAIKHLARRGEKPEEPSRIFALDLETGKEVWSSNSKVAGTFLIYSEPYDVLVEGGTHDVRTKRSDERALPDEPIRTFARRGEDGKVLWESDLDLPAAVRDDMLISASRHDRRAISLTDGEPWMREQVHTGEKSRWRYSKSKNCDAFNASANLLLFRTTYAGFFDLEHDTGTGFFSGFRSGCTANMIAADGVLNALDYTRSCTCPYGHQTSLAMIHMPEDSNIEFWTRYDGTTLDPTNHGLNFGAPGRRVDVAGSERVWHDKPGTGRRHPSAIEVNDGSLDWIAASFREIDNNEPITIEDLPDREYTVRLHFAELDEAVEPGQRVFDILVDGQKILSDYDIVERAGGPLRGIVESGRLEAGGIMTVELRKTEASELNPVISGIEIIAESSETTFR